MWPTTIAKRRGWFGKNINFISRIGQMENKHLRKSKLRVEIAFSSWIPSQLQLSVFSESKVECVGWHWFEMCLLFWGNICSENSADIFAHFPSASSIISE